MPQQSCLKKKPFLFNGRDLLIARSFFCGASYVPATVLVSEDTKAKAIDSAFKIDHDSGRYFLTISTAALH